MYVKKEIVETRLLFLYILQVYLRREITIQKFGDVPKVKINELNSFYETNAIF